MPVFMVHKNWAGACFVKGLEFFEAQGGNTKPWGSAWHRVLANDIEDARRICKETIDPYQEVATPYNKPAVDAPAAPTSTQESESAASVQACPKCSEPMQAIENRVASFECKRCNIAVAPVTLICRAFLRSANLVACELPSNHAGNHMNTDKHIVWTEDESRYERNKPDAIVGRFVESAMQKIRAAGDARLEGDYGPDVPKEECQPPFFSPDEIEAILFDKPLPKERR